MKYDREKTRARLAGMVGEETARIARQRRAQRIREGVWTTALVVFALLAAGGVGWLLVQLLTTRPAP